MLSDARNHVEPDANRAQLEARERPCSIGLLAEKWGEKLCLNREMRVFHC
jgi:hypothetical protein